MSQSVYAIEGAGLVKIGRSFVPEFRLKLMQSGSPVPLRLIGYIDGDHVAERQIHDRFKPYRAHGEWFRCDGEVKEWISKTFQRPIKEAAE